MPEKKRAQLGAAPWTLWFSKGGSVKRAWEVLISEPSSQARALSHGME